MVTIFLWTCSKNKWRVFINQLNFLWMKYFKLVYCDNSYLSLKGYQKFIHDVYVLYIIENLIKITLVCAQKKLNSPLKFYNSNFSFIQTHCPCSPFIHFVWKCIALVKPSSWFCMNVCNPHRFPRQTSYKNLEFFEKF